MSKDINTTATRYPQSNLAACMLPWTEDFKLDEAVFKSHVRSAIDEGYKCLYVMGTAGEGYALSDDRFRQAVEVFAGITVKDGLDPQVGVIGTCMDQMIQRIQFAYEMGIRMFQISLPCWGALDESEALLHFTTVCGSFSDCRFLHYNLPRARRIIRGAEYHRIAQEVPNLVATKNSSTDYSRTADLLTHAPELQHFLLESNYAMGCTVGECSLLCSYDVLFPQTTQQFFDAGLQKDFAELFRITKLLRDVEEALFSHCPRDMIDGSFDKTFIWLRHPEFSNRLLPPYIGLSETESRICREVFEKRFGHIA